MTEIYATATNLADCTISLKTPLDDTVYKDADGAVGYVDATTELKPAVTVRHDPTPAAPESGDEIILLPDSYTAAYTKTATTLDITVAPPLPHYPQATT